MIEFLKAIFITVQAVVGYQLVVPALLLIIWVFRRKSNKSLTNIEKPELDFAIIVTAYQHTNMLPGVIRSIGNLRYENYHVYIVADNCSNVDLDLNAEKFTLLIPEIILGSNTRSHLYAVNRLVRAHDCITIIDSDNLVHPDYLKFIADKFRKGFHAVQGLRAPKNLNTTIACLDAARDIYYHFYDGKILFEVGSSATLSGSGMAFDLVLYKNFLTEVDVQGAGFDKVLQSWLVNNKYRIAFEHQAIVYDEKTSKTDQLVQQRSRWISSWFKYAVFGLETLGGGVKKWDVNRILFGIVLLRPPLFIFLAISVLFMFFNLIIGAFLSAIIWIICLLIFVGTFFIPLLSSNTDSRIIASLRNVPKFIFYQFVSLLNVRRANKISVSTKHDREGDL